MNCVDKHPFAFRTTYSPTRGAAPGMTNPADSTVQCPGLSIGSTTHHHDHMYVMRVIPSIYHIGTVTLYVHAWKRL
jgi:hypothetical protein